MVRMLMFHTPLGDSFLYTYGEESSINCGERVKKYKRNEKNSHKIF